MNALEKLVDLLAAIALLFLIPLLYFEGVNRGAKAEAMGRGGEWLLQRISTAGVITEPVLREWERMLSADLCDGYELVFVRTLYEKQGDAVVKREYVTDVAKLREDAEGEVICSLLRGDRLYLTVFNNKIPAIHYATVRSGEER